MTQENPAPPKRIVCKWTRPPIPTCIQWVSYVEGFEERYGCCYGSTEEQAREAMVDWIECVDG